MVLDEGFDPEHVGVVFDPTPEEVAQERRARVVGVSVGGPEGAETMLLALDAAYHAMDAYFGSGEFDQKRREAMTVQLAAGYLAGGYFKEWDD